MSARHAAVLHWADGLGRAQCKSRQTGETHNGNLFSPLSGSNLRIPAGQALQHVLQLILLLLRMAQII